MGFQSSIVTALLGSPLLLSQTCTTGNCSWPDFNTFSVCSKCQNVNSKSTAEKVVLRDVDHSKNENGRDAVTNLYTTPGDVLLNVSTPYKICTEDVPGLLTDEGALITGNVTDGVQNGYVSYNQSIITFAAANNSKRPDESEKAGDGINRRKPLIYNAAADILECSLEWCAKSFKNGRLVSACAKSLTDARRFQ